MPDNKRKVGKSDDIRINVRQRWEVAYWTRKLRVSSRRLSKAVSVAGPMVRNVIKYLRRNK